MRTGWRWACGIVLVVLVVWAGGGCSSGAGDDLEGRLDRMLADSWRGYRARFISPEGRVVRPENDRDSISEGQAYALLRAVWSRDQATFDLVYTWTEANLSRRRTHGDELLSWRWGQTAPGRWGVLDANSASDADLDYALALILAERRWGRPTGGQPPYRDKALAVMRSILAKETVSDPRGGLWLTPGSWIGPGLPLLLNPSYFSPAHYRVFHGVSGDGRWLRLLETAYAAAEVLTRRLGDLAGVGLVPDWCQLAAPGTFQPAPGHSTAYGWEAVRLPWRLALDGLWFGQERSRRGLRETLVPFFRQRWVAGRGLVAVYSYQGLPVVDYESPVIYAGVAAAALAAEDGELARRAAARIAGFYREEAPGGYFHRPDDYYGNNWAWFGLATFRGWVRP